MDPILNIAMIVINVGLPLDCIPNYFILATTDIAII